MGTIFKKVMHFHDGSVGKQMQLSTEEEEMFAGAVRHLSAHGFAIMINELHLILWVTWSQMGKVVKNS